MNTYTSLSQRTNVWAVKQLLINMQPYMHIMNLAGQNSVALPENTNSTVSFRRYLDFPVNTTPLVEGTNSFSGAQAGNYQDMTKEDFSVSMIQYGAFTQLSDKVTLLMEDPVLQQAVERLGIQAGKVVETIGWNTLSACSQVLYTGTATSVLTTDTVFSTGTLRSAVRVLQSNNVEKISKMIGATPGYATNPVADAYYALIHTDQIKDLYANAEFFPVEKYPTTGGIAQGEVGKIEQIRFLQSTLYVPALGAGASSTTVKNTAGKADVYNIVILGKDAFTTVAVKGVYAAKIQVSMDGATTADPYNSSRTISWKLWYAICITNPKNLIRIVTASAL